MGVQHAENGGAQDKRNQHLKVAARGLHMGFEEHADWNLCAMPGCEPHGGCITAVSPRCCAMILESREHGKTTR